MVFMNYIVAWRLREKFFSFIFQVTGSMDIRPSKTKVFIWKFITITHSIIYHNRKAKKSFFAAQKSLRVLKLLRIFIDRLFLRFHSYIGSSLAFSLIGFSLGSSVIGSSLIPQWKGFLRDPQFFWLINALFPPCRYFFYQIVLFFIKNRYFILKNNLTISLRCFNNKNKQRNTYMIETKNIVLKIYAINSLIYTYHQIPDEYIVQFSSILLCWSLFRIKLEAWIQVFSCEYCKIFEEYLCWKTSTNGFFWY